MLQVWFPWILLRRPTMQKWLKSLTHSSHQRDSHGNCSTFCQSHSTQARMLVSWLLRVPRSSMSAVTWRQAFPYVLLRATQVPAWWQPTLSSSARVTSLQAPHRSQWSCSRSRCLSLTRWSIWSPHPMVRSSLWFTATTAPATSTPGWVSSRNISNCLVSK